MTVDLPIGPALHYREVVLVSPDGRSRFESYQPPVVLARQTLSKEIQGTIGATLSSQAEVTERSFGPGRRDA